MPIHNPGSASISSYELLANKTQLVRSSGTSSTLYPSESAVSGFVASSIANIPAAGGNIGSFLLSGGGVTWVTGYQFRVSAAQYYIQGVLYSSAEQLITLTASDGTFDRIDVIVVNTSGQVDKVTGVATSSPSEPDIDPATQLQLAFIIVYAASSSPIINSQTIYSEDAGSPTEWNWSSTGSTWNLASTNNPFAGTKDIEATNIGSTAYAQGMATGTVNLSIYTQLNFYIRSKGTWNSGRGLYIAWYSNGVRKGNNIFLAHGFFNFNSDNTTDYQLISIPTSQFAVPNGTTINQLRFSRVGGNISFYLDEIIVTDSGLTSTPVGLTQDQADARYVLRVGTTDNAIMRADGATGEIQNSLATVSDTGVINIPTGTTFNIGGVPHTHTGVGSSIANDPIWSAKGQLAVGVGSATGTVLSVGTNDYVLTADSTASSGLKWASGGGATALKTVWMPDAPPSSPSAYNDEFLGGSGTVPSSGLWTERDPNNVLTVNESATYNALLLTQSTRAGDNITGITQSIPAGDFTIWTKLSVLAPGTNYGGFGLGLWEDATNTSKRVVFFNLSSRSSGGPYDLVLQNFTSPTQYLNDVWALPTTYNGTLYMRWRRNSTNYYTDWSIDGYHWACRPSADNPAYTPLHFGLLAYNNNVGVDIMAVFHFFRYINSDVGRTGIMQGRLGKIVA